jgi:hypothetical protein|tara:strand:+ start:18 stop:149 length:132 start_codon:yes stop_codon:yes gene_type:complete
MNRLEEIIRKLKQEREKFARMNLLTSLREEVEKMIIEESKTLR